ncbi:GD13412 [Drosophila simulans]|uniref:GD13412 n=1 Tax=Drosophila simulans TaxID=7240 RepID=B4QN25_DROSI|nr:GD13412 [Drosophila simulans]
MERRQALDSSMSSLYSVASSSNPNPRQPHTGHQLQTQQSQQSQQSQLDAFNYSATMSSSSPTPSQAMSTAMSTGTGTGTTHTTPPSSSLRATTIGTVVVRCGPIQLVIALLQVKHLKHHPLFQSPEKIYIKVVELEPKITALGENLDESLRMQREHDETLRNLQRSGKLLATKWADAIAISQSRIHLPFCHVTQSIHTYFEYL